MFCFGTPHTGKKKPKTKLRASIVIHTEFPKNPAIYLPKLSEHRVQDEADIIDDPSSIFFDPKEKPGFVYKAVPTITNNYVYPNYEPKHILAIDNKHLTKVLENHPNDEPISSEYDDSLDRTQSFPNTPSYKTDNIFDQQFEASSRRTSLEFDPIGADGDYHTALIEDEDFATLLQNAPRLSESDVNTFYDTNNHEQHLVDDYSDLYLYEEDLLFDCSASRNTNKGYISDAESVKTYQDSGIYDDDVFIESPKSITNEDFAQVAHMFGKDDEKDNKKNLDCERFSAFKTPNSSRQNSLELILTPDTPVEPPLLQQFQPPQPPQPSQAKKEIPSSGYNERSWKNKYSHIQAKVQSHRTKGERSPSPGTPLNIKSPPKSPSYKPMTFVKGKNRTSSFKFNVKAKVDSLSNIKYVPGGGDTKVFKEKLTFRQRAEPRTDSHGIEMYAHLPAEFQEIARRLARQDLQLKNQDVSRGRSLNRSRNSSLAASSRHSSPSSPPRGRSLTRRPRRLTPGNSISNIYAAVNLSKSLLESPTKTQPSLSRSSSIRSIPATPHLSKLHPSSVNIRKSPATSPGPNMTRHFELKKKEEQSTSSVQIEIDKKFFGVKSVDLMPSPVSKLYQFTTQNDTFGSP